MPDKDIMLTAGLDQSDVFKSLDAVEKRVSSMVKSNNKSMQAWGTAMDGATKQWRKDLEGFISFFEARTKAGMTFKSLAPDTMKSYEDLTKTIRELGPALEVVVKQMRGLETMKAVDLGTGKTSVNVGKSRNEIRDEITREFANIRADILRVKLEEIMAEGLPVVRDAATNIRTDLVKAFLDPTASGQELLATVNLLEASFKNLGAAALSYELIPVGVGQATMAQAEDITKGIFAKEKGNEVLAEIDNFMKTADTRVAAGVETLRSRLVKLLEVGPAGLGGEELKTQINGIVTEFNQLSGLKPLDLIQDKEVTDAVRLEVAYRAAGQAYAEIMRTGDSAAKAQAPRLEELIQKEHLLASTRKKSTGDAAGLIEGYLGQLRRLSQFKVEDPVAKIAAEGKTEVLRDYMFKVMDSGHEVLSQYAAIYRAELTKLMNDPPPADKLKARLNEIEREINEVIEALRQGQDVSFSIEGVGGVGGSRKVIEEQLRLGQAEFGGEQLQQRIAAVMDSLTDEVQTEALQIQALLKGLFDIPLGADKAEAEIAKFTTAVRNIEAQAPKKFDPFKEIATGEQANALRDRMFKIMDNSTGVVRDAAAAYRAELTKMINDPPPNDELIARLNQIKSTMDELQQQAMSGQDIAFTPEGFGGMGGQREALEELRQLGEAEFKVENLKQRAEDLMFSISDDVTTQAHHIRTQLQDLFTGEFRTEDIQARVQTLTSALKELEKVKAPELIEAEEAATVDDVTTAYEEFKSVYAELVEVGSDGALELADSSRKLAVEAEKSTSQNKKNNAEVVKTINARKRAVKTILKQEKEANEQAKEAEQRAKDLAKAQTALGQAAEKVKLADAYKRFNAVIEQSKRLLKSTNSDARAVGQALKDAGEKGVQGLREGGKVTEELNDNLKETENLARSAGAAFKADLAEGVDKAKVHVWKLGNALDRMGVRGGGGIARIIDAFGSLGPQVIAGALAIGGMIIVVQKLTQAVIELGKRAAQAFTEFIKGSVDTAKAIQVTDRHLGALYKNADLGPRFRNFLLDKSFELGFDLTGDFSRVVIPLAKTTDEITEAAEQAAILSHAFQKTEESVSRAFKQMAGGHSRPFQQLFGITPQEIDKIQEYQAEWGNLQGIIMGLEEALAFRGLDMTVFEGTLQLIMGQLGVLRKQVELAVGTPVRDALARQLDAIFSLVEDKGPLIDRVFSTLGTTVGGVVDRIGEFVRALIGNISDEDVITLEESMTELGTKVELVIAQLQTMFTSEDTSIIDTMIGLTEAINGVADALNNVLGLFNGIKAINEGIRGVGLPQWLVDELPEDLKFLGEIQSGDIIDIFKPSPLPIPISPAIKSTTRAGAGLLTTLGQQVMGDEGEAVSIYDSVALLAEIASGLPGGEGIGQYLVDVIQNEDDLARATAAVTRAMVEQGDVLEEVQAAMDEGADATDNMKYSMEEIEDAIKTVSDAERKMALDREHREADLVVKQGRKKIDQRLKESQDFEDLYRDHLNDLRELDFDLVSDREKAEEGRRRKDTASEVKYKDKLSDIDRKAATKRIKIEEKYREKLEDIRRRFDLDAEEAIRRNDAVALLRVRRRMRAELEEAKVQRDRQQDEVDDSAAYDRETAKIQLERARRDSQTALDLKQDDIDIADDEKREKMHRQLMWEKKELEIEHKRQTDIMKEERKRAFEDLETDFEQRKESMELQYEDEYEIVKYWKDLEHQHLKLALELGTSLLDKTLRIWGQKAGGMFQFLNQLYSGFNMMGTGMFGDEFDPSGVIWMNSPNTPISDFFGGIGQRFSSGYNDFLDWWNNLMSGNRQHGGYVTSGNIYGVNERGVEAFMATRAGIVLPREAMMLAPPSSLGSTSIDNSKHLNADVDMLNATDLSPMMRTMARSILTDEILNIGF